MYKHITVSGNDAVEFLQGQLTQDVSQLESSGEQFAAWCNPKGRVICTLTLVQNIDSIGLVIPATIAEAVLKRLMMYRLRSAVEFDADETASESESLKADPHALIEAGIPIIDASNSEKFTPHMLNLDKLGAISFSKGCYTGQEIVARTENLGQSKRRMHRYRASTEGIVVGDDVALDERNIGKVVNVFERDLLAVTPVVSSSHTLVCGDATLKPVALPYAL